MVNWPTSAASFICAVNWRSRSLSEAGATPDPMPIFATVHPAPTMTSISTRMTTSPPKRFAIAVSPLQLFALDLVVRHVDDDVVDVDAEPRTERLEVAVRRPRRLVFRPRRELTLEEPGEVLLD